MFTWMKTTAIPPLDISDIRVSITIHSSINTPYIAEIESDVEPASFPIHLKPHDVKSLNTSLQKAIQQVAATFGTGAAYESALSELAKAGNYAFRQIFPDPSAQKFIHDALTAGSIIRIRSDDFLIPWELLYSKPTGAKDSIENYWGMNHVIWRVILPNKPHRHVPPVFRESRPRVGLIAFDQLPYVSKQEIPALQRLDSGKAIELMPLPTLVKAQRGSLKQLARFLSQDLHILHVACHAYEQDPIEESYLFVTRDFPISMIDVVVNNFELRNRPFVILNACLTGTMNPLYTSFWAERFWNMGARGVLATDFQIPDWFAADFSAALYQHLLAGESIGESLLAMRRHFWNYGGQHNLMGLAYALYASPSIQFLRTDNV